MHESNLKSGVINPDGSKNLLRSPIIDSQPGGIDSWAY
jgi:hypothetical protein